VVKAVFGEARTYVRRVRVDDLAEEQLGAHSENLDDHSSDSGSARFIR
jgi:hypothetical protein